ncbi:MAG: YdcF family protein [Candidatus Aquirickettsiella gammari]|uniref:YdcF family protein n=1 Tax=Candidatus Aquirickettsiella gammari TaxID=2016198 RepID=A0A370CMI8_9COXI|nr:MAG: YdcF family protein [Candidatus Aquirickettsiella gammari]
MSTVFIFIFLVLSIFFGLVNYIKTGFILGLLAIISFIVVGDGFFPAYLLHNLQAPYSQTRYPSWKKTNTLLLLGAGTSKVPGSRMIKPSILSFSRIIETARLYRACKLTQVSCHILISGGDPLNNGKSEAATYRDSLLSLDVNPGDIQLESQSRNTYENAEFSSYLLKKQARDQILLISSGLVIKRALLYFSYFNIHPVPIASDFITIPISKLPLGYNFAMSDFAAHEYLGIARFYIYNFLGWNKK